MAANTQIMMRDQRVTNIRNLLEKSKPQMEMALPKHVTADRLLRIAMTSIQKTPKLLDCTPQSLIAAVMQSAQLGLEPDGVLGQAYLVPYKTTCQLIPGYKGLLKLARNSGDLSTIQAHAVHENDHFEFAYGLEPTLKHTPTLDDPGRVIAFYAVARLKDGGYQFEVMGKKQVDEIRARSRAANDGPWVTDYEEMGKKTVIRRLAKMLPASVELARAVALDERAAAGLPQEIDTVFDMDVEAEDVTTGNGNGNKSTLDAIVDEAEKNGKQPAADNPRPRPVKPPDPITGEEPAPLSAEDIEYMRKEQEAEEAEETEGDLFNSGKKQ
jgi:recombination protein RecT